MPRFLDTEIKYAVPTSHCAYSFNFSLSHLVAVSTPSSMFSGLVPWPWRVGSFPPDRPPMTSETEAAHFSAVTPWEERCYRAVSM